MQTQYNSARVAEALDFLDVQCVQPVRPILDIIQNEYFF